MFTTSIRRTTIAFTTALMGALMVSSAAFAWEGWTNGQPPQLDHGAKGYFIWHNDNGWHLRSHDDANGATYRGVLRTDGEFQDVELIRAESTEDLSVEDGGRTIRFRFRTYSHIDGLNFRVDGGSYIRLDLETNGHQTPPRQIFLGGAGRHPAHNPFVLHR